MVRQLLIIENMSGTKIKYTIRRGCSFVIFYKFMQLFFFLGGKSFVALYMKAKATPRPTTDAAAYPTDGLKPALPRSSNSDDSEPAT